MLLTIVEKIEVLPSWTPGFCFSQDSGIEKVRPEKLP